MQTKARDKEMDVPYVYAYYNVMCYAEGPLEHNRSIISRMANTITRSLNEKDRKMPRLMLIIPDLDILKAINHFGFGVSHIIGRDLEWLMNAIDQDIDSKKDALRKRRPGALLSGEPKLVWFAIPNRPTVRREFQQHMMLAAREKFNKTLGELCAKRSNHYIVPEAPGFNIKANFNNDLYLSA